jgi:predicted CopG family antitoxin
MEAVENKKRNRRSFAEMLSDLHAQLSVLDTMHQARRERLIDRIDAMKTKHQELALAVETVGNRSLEEVEAELDGQLADLKARKAAVRRLK